MIFACLRQPKQSEQLKALLGNHVQTPYWNIYYDEGWQESNSSIRKGHVSLDYSNGLNWTFGALRNFPVYFNDYGVSNFDKSFGETLPIDAILQDQGQKFSVSYIKNFYTAQQKASDFESSVNVVKKSIIENLQKIDKNTINWLPDRGGIDTLTIRSALDFLDIPYQLFDFKNVLPKRSDLCNELLRSHWGFNQIPEYNGNVITGFYGDEFVLRNPYYVHVILSLRNINITEIFDARPECYMFKYFANYRHKCSAISDKNLNQLEQMIMNDFQIWDMNATTFMNPFRHKNLLGLLHADNETIISQVTDAAINKKIIEDFNPILLDRLDNFKNENDPYWFD